LIRVTDIVLNYERIKTKNVWYKCRSFLG